MRFPSSKTHNLDSNFKTKYEIQLGQIEKTSTSISQNWFPIQPLPLTRMNTEHYSDAKDNNQKRDPKSIIKFDTQSSLRILQSILLNDKSTTCFKHSNLRSIDTSSSISTSNFPAWKLNSKHIITNSILKNSSSQYFHP